MRIKTKRLETQLVKCKNSYLRGFDMNLRMDADLCWADLTIPQPHLSSIDTEILWGRDTDRRHTPSCALPKPVVPPDSFYSSILIMKWFVSDEAVTSIVSGVVSG